MDAERIQVGDVRRVFARGIKDANGDPADPSTLTLLIRPIGQAVPDVYTFGVDAEITREALGDFHGDIPLTTWGTWFYDWDGTGAATFSKGGSFYVYPKNTA